MEAIILAGGFGTRLQATVSDVPKSLALINDQPFLNFLFSFLIKYKIKRAILATGYLHHKIEEFYGNSYKDLEIEYSVEQEPLGTGGGIKQAFAKLSSDNVLIMNGDTYFNVNIQAMLKVHTENDADLTIALKPLYNISRYGVVKVEETRVKRFEEKKQVDFGYINGGVYIAKKELFKGFELPERFSLEEDFLKKFTSDLQLHCFISDTYFIDIGIPEDYYRAQSELKKYE